MGDEEDVMVYEEALAWVIAHQSDDDDDAAHALVALVDVERRDERSKTRQEASAAVMSLDLHQPRHEATPSTKWHAAVHTGTSSRDLDEQGRCTYRAWNHPAHKA
jgi:hypothetical protein